MNTTLTRAIPAAVIALFAGAASAQVEVVYASTSHSLAGVKTAVPNMPGETFKNFYFPSHSPSTARWICLSGINTSAVTDQVLLVGQGSSAISVAREGTYADAYGNTFDPVRLFYFAALTNASVADNGDWIADVSSVTGTPLSGDHIIRGTLTPFDQSPHASAAVTGGAAADGGAYGVFNVPNLTAAGPSFQAGVTGTAYPSAGYINGVPVLKVGVDIPSAQFGGTTLAWSGLDRDYFFADRTGTHWLAKGLLTGGARIVALDGVVLAEVGFPYAGMPDVITAISDCYLDPSGDVYIRGTNTGSITWATKNGVKVARRGEPIHVGATELWVTIQDVKGNAHGDYVVLGTTNAAAPNDQVMVVNNKAVIVRRSDGVDLDGDHVNDPGLFLHTASAGRMTPNDDGYLYYATQMKANAADTGGIPPNNNSLVRLPMCPADLGVQGGLPGVDGLFDNNDFVVFIDNFFTNNPRADIGKQGGTPGRDLLFDNNDFVVFIDLFFTACR